MPLVVMCLSSCQELQAFNGRTVAGSARNTSENPPDATLSAATADCIRHCVAQFSRSSINNLTYKIIAAAIEVHRQLGPGLLESVYQCCMERELAARSLSFDAGHAIGLVYKGMSIDCGFRIDLWVERLVIVELKSVQELSPIHEAQLLTYLKLTGAPIGLLINFNVTSLRKGVRKMLNKEHELVDYFSPV